jgi:secreted trypsin-like serine protease
MMKLKPFYFTGCVFLTSTALLSQTTLAQSEMLIPSGKSNEVQNTQKTARIIGGKEAETYPWMVSLHNKSDEGNFCAGALIHPYWVLTAAHCVDGFRLGKTLLSGDDLFVVVGLHKQSRLNEEGERLEVSRVIQHPQWRSINLNSHFDIALLQLTKPATQPPIALPLQGSPAPGKKAIAMGWGNTVSEDDDSKTDVLQEVELDIVSNDTCTAAYKGEYDIIDNQICAGFATGGKDTCTGDSGGPLIVSEGNQQQQIGIVSYGGKQEGPLCGGPDAYGVYTRVSAFINFIAQFVPLSVAGAYDGIWISSALPNVFFMLKNTADTFFIVIFNDNGQRWQALAALINNSTLTLNSIIGSVNIEAEFEAIITPSPPITEATLTVTTCQPKPESAEAICLFSADQTIPLNRIF